MKKRKEDSTNALSLTADELIAKVSKCRWKGSKTIFVPLLALCLVLPVVHGMMSLKGIHMLDQESDAILPMASPTVAATTVKKDMISIPSGTIKANPFLPYRDIDSAPGVDDVPRFDLVQPPDVVQESSDAARVMDTVVSGILYDKYSPSAILNIEGNDYLVKKGDVVNNYKVISIAQDNVTVQLGSNTYKAGIGEILTDGSINHNDVSNLNKKFGGERR